MKKAKGKAETYTHMDPVEIDRAEHWYQEGKTPHEIAGLLDRHPRTIRNHLFATKSVAKVGRPKMPERDYEKCAKALDQLQKARPGKEITVAMVKATVQRQTQGSAQMLWSTLVTECVEGRNGRKTGLA